MKLDAERVGDGDRVVGAVLQAERLAGPQPATVPAMVERDTRYRSPSAW
jgi:hypothetical protein